MRKSLWHDRMSSREESIRCVAALVSVHSGHEIQEAKKVSNANVNSYSGTAIKSVPLNGSIFRKVISANTFSAGMEKIISKILH